MKNSILIFIFLLSIISCKKENETPTDVLNKIKQTTEVVAKEGSGKVALICNGQEFIAEGVCGALVTMGELTIAVKDKTNPAKVFMITLNGEDFPENGKVYKIKSKDYTKDGKGPNDEVGVSFSEGLPNNKMNTWGSENAKGTIQFFYNGNEAKCVLKDIVLSASEMFNADDLKANGTVTGELTFYKN